MTSRAPDAGFTLIEVTVVLAVLGLVGGLVLARGPQRSATLDMRAAATSVAQTMKGARTRAIATNSPVVVLFSSPPATIQVTGGPVRALPAGIGLTVTSTADLAAGNRAAIQFLPDGSSSGGRVELGDGARSVTVGVDWITGRVSVANAP